MISAWAVVAASPLAVGLTAYGLRALEERRQRRHSANSWHREQVEMFLHCASDDDYSFKGFEWADYASNAELPVRAEKGTPQPAAVGEYAHHYFPPRFEPPFVRMRCADCRDEWDVWINEAGEPENPRDLRCDCGAEGEPVVDD